MRWRNQLLAIACLLVFLGLGVLYFKHWVVQKPFAIILFVGEGMDASRLGAARIYARSADTPLALDALPHTAFLKNFSADSATADQAAANTAFATGVKVNNGTLANSADAKSLPTLLELARDSGRMTGLVTNASLTSVASAAFYSRARPDDAASLTSDLLKADIDVVLGGGHATIDQHVEDAGAQTALESAGYEFVASRRDLEEVPKWRRAKLFGLFAEEQMAFADEVEHGTDQPSLADMVRRSIELLQYNRGGYLLVVHAGLMRKAAAENDGQRTLMETVELDRALAVAMRYAGAKSLIIVCGDVGIGGLHLNGTPAREDGGLELLDSTPAGVPWLTWATGPNAPPHEPNEFPLIDPVLQLQVESPEANSPSPRTPYPTSNEPAAAHSTAAAYTAGDVPAFGTGLGANALHGTIENTRIFTIIRDNL